MDLPASFATPVLYRPNTSARPRVDRAEMLRYLGYGGQEIDLDLERRIVRCVEELELSIEPKGVRRTFCVDASGTDDDGMPCIQLVDSEIALTGRDIYRHLKDAAFCTVLACTLGMDCERKLRTLASQQALDAALFDAACSSYIEAAVEQMDRDVRTQAANVGLSANWRFSPGYGDCPLSAQPSILAALNASRLLGLTATTTNLLMPTKSVTAFIGLFDGPVHDANTRPACNICRLRPSCAFRARGETCYGEKTR